MFSFFVKNQSIYIFKPMESFLKLLLHIIAFIWALNNFDHAKARFLPSSDGPWSSCNAQKGKIFMENECKQLLLCYRSNLTNGNAKKAQNFGQSKIYKNGTHQFKECAKVMAKGKQWHGLIITRDGPDTLRLESSLGFDGVFDAVQMNNSEKVTEIDMLKINEQLERELQKELNVGTFFDDFRENVLAFDFVSPLYGKNDTTKWCQTKCLSQLSERQTMIAPQRKAFRFNWWALPDGIPPLDCARLFGNDQTYIAQMVKQRIRRKDEPAEHALDMSCEAIRNRNRFWHETEDGKDNYPLAQIRIVYKDYVLVELDLAATFSPLNWYCYVIDSMATELFKRRVHALAYCFSNVIVADERRVDNSGAGMMEAVLDCFGRLVTAQRKWEYVTLLQNHDTAIKTHVQMAQIFAWMEGANDVLETVPPNDRHDNIEHMDWSFAALNLFQNASRNSAVSAAAVADGHPAHLQLSKGAFQVSLCRAMVEFILRELNLTEFVRRINLIGYGQDETMLVTLHTADQLNAPGGFTQTCRNPKNAGPTNYLTREVLWKQPYMSCSTGFWRHSVCVFGIEDLARLTTLPHLFFNKFWPPFDFGATLCMYERLFNMTHLHTAKEQLDNMAPVVNKTVVQQLPNVRFQLFKKYMLLKPKRPNSDHLLTFDEVMQFRCPDKEKFWILFWRAIKDSPGNGIIIFAMASVTIWRNLALIRTMTAM